MRNVRGLFVGLTTVDLVQRVARLPGANEKVVATRADLAAGGPAANAAVTFAALGGRATLLTVVGAGGLAATATEDLRRHGVTVVDAGRTSGDQLAISAITVVEGTGERSVVSRNAEGVDVEVPERLPDLVADADVVLLDGHHPRLAVAAARAATREGVPVVLDAGSWKPVLVDVLPLTRMAVCSADFRLADGRRADGSLLDSGPGFVAVTAGAEPVRWWTRDDAGVVRVPSVTARDTLGAGDVFHGAFAFAVATGKDEVEALTYAAGVASVRVGHVGPRSWLTDARLRAFSPGTPA